MFILRCRIFRNKRNQTTFSVNSSAGAGMYHYTMVLTTVAMMLLAVQLHTNTFID